MEKRERVLIALNLEEPDRVPTHVIYLDANNMDIILGLPLSTFCFIDYVEDFYETSYIL